MRPFDSRERTGQEKGAASDAKSRECHAANTTTLLASRPRAHPAPHSSTVAQGAPFRVSVALAVVSTRPPPNLRDGRAVAGSPSMLVLVAGARRR